MGKVQPTVFPTPLYTTTTTPSTANLPQQLQLPQQQPLLPLQQLQPQTRRASLVSNSYFFYKTEGLRVKDGG